MSTRELLPEQTPEQARRESSGLREIAIMMGKDEQWDDPIGLCEAVALIVTRSGLPNPGDDRNTEAYLDYSNAIWEAQHPEAVS